MRKRQIPILGPSYVDPNLHWSRQDTLNWLLVKAEQGGTLTEWQLRDAPGVEPFVRITREVEDTILDIGPVRGMRNVEGKLFVVAAQTLYQISNNGVAIPFGTIPGVARVSMAHNQSGLGNELIIVNGSAGYVFNTNFNTLTKITDEGYPGAFIADYIDQYLAQVEPQGRFWFHSDLANGTDYNTLDRYEAEADPDRIVSLIVSHREVLVFGRDTIEPFVNTGGQTGTFERASNTVIEVGCAAKFTPRKLDNSVFWLDDKRLVRRLDGYTPIRISTDAIDSAFQECSEAEVANCYAFVWESRGHKVYYITVPGRFTFGYDVLTGSWHRRSTWNMKHWDVVDTVYWNGRWITGSGRFGRLYELDWDYKLDGCDPLVRQRVTGKLWDDENELTLNNVELKFNTGGKESVCVLFPDQPAGPSISGNAPDGVAGEAFSFTYTTTPGDSPIARTILMPGSYIVVAGETVPLLGSGWLWNQSTATISNPTPASMTMVHLVMRVYDQNGLYADHTDDFMVAEAYEILISGQNLGVGQPYMCKFNNVGDTTIVGIAQSTGATLNDAVGLYDIDDPEWAIVGPNGSRFAPSLSDNWTTGTAPNVQFSEVFSDPGGRIATSGGSIYGESGGNYTLITRTATNPANQIYLGSAYRTVRRYSSTDDKWYWFGLADQFIGRCEDPRTDTWDTVRLWPGVSESARALCDIIEIDGTWYGVGIVNGTDMYGVCMSTDDMATFPLDGVLFSVNENANAPLRIDSIEGVLITYCLNGYVRSDGSDWEQIYSGMAGVTISGDIPLVAQVRSRKRAIGGLLYMVGTGDDAGRYVTFNPVTQTFSSPVSMPITGAVGIASRKI